MPRLGIMHPNYIYSAWSEGRRRAASLRAKEAASKPSFWTAENIEVLLCCRRLGLTYKETAAELGTTVGSVAGQLDRMRHGDSRPAWATPEVSLIWWSPQITEIGEEDCEPGWHPIGSVPDLPRSPAHLLVCGPDVGTLTVRVVYPDSAYPFIAKGGMRYSWAVFDFWKHAGWP